MSPSTDDLRAGAVGVVPLPGRLEPWLEDLLSQPDQLSAAISEHGSPVNVIDPRPLGRNARELVEAAESRNVAFRIFFARKANKALCLVDEALRPGHAIDVGSERELRQVLDRGAQPDDVIVTAAVKPRALLELCVESGVTVSIDNLDEWALLAEIAADRGATTPVALRLAPEGDDLAASRFGLTRSEVTRVAADASAQLEIGGVHFHLDGYSVPDRVVAGAQALASADELRAAGHPVAFCDIGGGIPMSYLESEADWELFWEEHQRAQAGECEHITYEGHTIGKVYPYFQRPVRGEWLGLLLDSEIPGHGTFATALSERGLELRCEPGRSLLDGCGTTIARVEFRKQRADGTWLVGLAMNRTQCRSTSDDFMVDPILVRPSDAGEPTGAIEAYLVGAYCVERELLTWRRLRFPRGVAVGDLVVFPNTAGYLMHILESASHQIPLARNLVARERGLELDAIDARGDNGPEL